MKKNMLIVTSVSSMVDQFMLPNIDLLFEMGYHVHVACNFETGNNMTPEKVIELKRKLDIKNVKYYQVDFDRNILDFKKHIKAYKQINEIIHRHTFDFIHCHSPIGGAIGRIVGHNNNIRVIYTAHGFHFFKGAPLKNWVMFYPIEKILSYITDTIIVINNEDYQLALKKLKAKKIKYLPGIGLDLRRFENKNQYNKLLIREKNGISKDNFVLISIGELNENKNHSIILRAISELNDKNIHYIICGQGKLYYYLKQLSIELGIENQVHLLGFRKDIIELCVGADVFVFPSLREGLGMGALEGMASGLPLITSNVHGIIDYSINNVTGLTCNPHNVKEFSNAIKYLKDNEVIREKLATNGLEYVKKFDENSVLPLLKEIYIK